MRTSAGRSSYRAESRPSSIAASRCGQEAPLEPGRRNHVRAQAVARHRHDGARKPDQRPDQIELHTEREVDDVTPWDEDRHLGRADRLDELVVAEERLEARPPRGG